MPSPTARFVRSAVSWACLLLVLFLSIHMVDSQLAAVSGVTVETPFTQVGYLRPVSVLPAAAAVLIDGVGNTGWSTAFYQSSLATSAYLTFTVGDGPFSVRTAIPTTDAVAIKLGNDMNQWPSSITVAGGGASLTWYITQTSVTNGWLTLPFSSGQPASGQPLVTTLTSASFTVALAPAQSSSSQYVAIQLMEVGFLAVMAPSFTGDVDLLQCSQPVPYQGDSAGTAYSAAGSYVIAADASQYLGLFNDVQHTLITVDNFQMTATTSTPNGTNFRFAVYTSNGNDNNNEADNTFTLLTQSAVVHVPNGTSIVSANIPPVVINIKPGGQYNNKGVVKWPFLVTVAADQPFTTPAASSSSHTISFASDQQAASLQMPSTYNMQSASSNTIAAPTISILLCSTTDALSHFAFDVDTSEHVSAWALATNPGWTVSTSVYQFGGGSLLLNGMNGTSGAAASAQPVSATDPTRPGVMPLSTPQWTVSFWVFYTPTNGSSDVWQLLTFGSNAYNLLSTISIDLQSGTLAVNQAANGQCCGASIGLNSSTWHHVVFANADQNYPRQGTSSGNLPVFNPNGLYMYVDNVLVYNGVPLSMKSSASADTFTFGGRSNKPQPSGIVTQGLLYIDELWTFNLLLETPAIGNLYMYNNPDVASGFPSINAVVGEQNIPAMAEFVDPTCAFDPLAVRQFYDNWYAPAAIKTHTQQQDLDGVLAEASFWSTVAHNPAFSMASIPPCFPYPFVSEPTALKLFEYIESVIPNRNWYDPGVLEMFASQMPITSQYYSNPVTAMPLTSDGFDLVSNQQALAPASYYASNSPTYPTFSGGALTTPANVVVPLQQASFSFSIWLNLNAAPGYIDNALITSYDGGANTFIDTMYSYSTGLEYINGQYLLYMGVGTNPDGAGSTNYQNQASGAVPANINFVGVWNMVIFVYDAANGIFTIYVNGEQIVVTDANPAIPFEPQGNLPIQLGIKSFTSGALPGSLRCFAQWDHAISAAHAAALYNNQPNGTCTTLDSFGPSAAEMQQEAAVQARLYYTLLGQRDMREQVQSLLRVDIVNFFLTLSQNRANALTQLQQYFTPILTNGIESQIIMLQQEINELQKKNVLSIVLDVLSLATAVAGPFVEAIGSVASGIGELAAGLGTAGKAVAGAAAGVGKAAETYSKTSSIHAVFDVIGKVTDVVKQSYEASDEIKTKLAPDMAFSVGDMAPTRFGGSFNDGTDSYGYLFSESQIQPSSYFDGEFVTVADVLAQLESLNEHFVTGLDSIMQQFLNNWGVMRVMNELDFSSLSTSDVESSLGLVLQQQDLLWQRIMIARLFNSMYKVNFLSSYQGHGATCVVVGNKGSPVTLWGDGTSDPTQYVRQAFGSLFNGTGTFGYILSFKPNVISGSSSYYWYDATTFPNQTLFNQSCTATSIAQFVGGTGSNSSSVVSPASVLPQASLSTEFGSVLSPFLGGQ